MTLALGEPLTASLLGIFLLSEHLTLFGFIGIGFLFSGLTLLTQAEGVNMDVDGEDFYLDI